MTVIPEVPRFVFNIMRIYALLCFAFSWVAVTVADKIDGCQILQTTDTRTPCYILIKQAPTGVPPFVYMLNLPRPTPQTPCPVSQTLDASFSCYVPPSTKDDPAFILNVPLPPGADDIDDSPAGKAKLRDAKANPIFHKASLNGGQRPLGSSQQIGQGSFGQPQRFGFSSGTFQYNQRPQAIPQQQPFGAQPTVRGFPQTGQVQPSFQSSFDQSQSRLPQPIGLTKSIEQTQPIGPPSPQLTKALFKPLAPSTPQKITPSSPQNQFIFRTVPNLFQYETSSTLPKTQTFHHVIRYRNQQPVYYTSFTQSAQRDVFPYPSSEGRGSINAFEGPYPARYEYQEIQL